MKKNTKSNQKTDAKELYKDFVEPLKIAHYDWEADNGGNYIYYYKQEKHIMTQHDIELSLKYAPSFKKFYKETEPKIENARMY